MMLTESLVNEPLPTRESLAFRESQYSFSQPFGRLNA